MQQILTVLHYCPMTKNWNPARQKALYFWSTHYRQFITDIKQSACSNTQSGHVSQCDTTINCALCNLSHCHHTVAVHDTQYCLNTAQTSLTVLHFRTLSQCHCCRSHFSSGSRYAPPTECRKSFLRHDLHTKFSENRSKLYGMTYKHRCGGEEGDINP